MSAIKFAQIEPTARCSFKCASCVGGFMAHRDVSIETLGAAPKLCSDLEQAEQQGKG